MLYVCDQPHSHWWEQLYYPYQPNSPHNSKHLFDIYSLTHIFWPLLITLCINTWISPKYRSCSITILVLSVIAFEIHENQHQQIRRYQRIETDSMGHSSYRGDTLINSIGDIICNLLGIYLGLYMHRHTNIYILFALFIIITNTLSITYWTDFVQFI